MPLLPDKFAVGARLPQNTRSVAGISYDSPTYQAGEGFGRAITGLGSALRPKEKEKEKPADGALALSQMQTAIDTAEKGLAAAPDPDQGGINGAEYLQQVKAKIQSSLGADDLKRYGPSIEAMTESGLKRLGEQVEGRRREAKVAEVETLFPQLAAQHAVLTDPTARQEIGAALFGSIDRLAQAGDIDAARAQAMKLGLQRQLVRADVLAQPADWRAEHLRAGGEGRFFRDALGAEDADFMHAQAVQEQVLNRRETGTQDLLQRFGSSTEGEEKALAEIGNAQEGDPAFKALYLGKLAALRTQERRAVALSAGNAYRLAIEGRDGEIDPADRQRLHKAGQMDGILEAAQFARHANPKGDLLFKERLLAMSPEERAGYGVAELAKRLSSQDFLEVTQGAAGRIDDGQHERMRDFVPMVRSMLRTVTVGKYATAQEQERDRRFLGLVHDEVKTLVADEEKKLNGRALTVVEYQGVLRQATDRALLRDELMEVEQRTASFRDALYMDPEVA